MSLADVSRSSRLTADQAIETRAIFNEIDASKSGGLDKEEFNLALDVRTL